MADSPKSDKSDKSREADYTDYESRNVRDGWPYSDEDSATGRELESGNPSRVLAEDEPSDMQVSDETAIQSSGGPQIDPESEDGNIEADDLEEQIYNMLSDTDDVDATNVTVTVRDGVATISGSVETRENRALVDRMVGSVAGIRETRNELSTTGVGSHIPPDYDQ